MKKSLFLQVFIVLLLVLGYFTISSLKLFEEKPLEYVLQEQCDLHKSACNVLFDDNSTLSLEIFPKDIPLMEEIKFKVISSKELNEDLALKVYATNMAMGEFNIKLKKISAKVYEIQTILPTCPIGEMNWNIDIKVNKLSKDINARYQFETE